MSANIDKIGIEFQLGPFYDAHCHYQDGRLSAWFSEFGETVGDLGIRKAVVNGTSPQDWENVANLASRFEYVIPSFGLHPWFVDQSYSEAISRLEILLDDRLFPIGEIGLDRWIQGYDIDLQKEAFVLQLRLAKQQNVPVTIHCLRAFGLLLEILQKEGPFETGFLIHSYGGPIEMIPRFLEVGAYFSFSGYFALPEKEKKRKAYGAVPLDRVLIETDSPDMLGPSSVCSGRSSDGANYPSNIVGIYEYAAEMFGKESIEFREIVESNFLRLFGRWAG